MLVAGVATTGYRWVTHSRPVSAEDAVARYRAAAAADAPPSPTPTPSPAVAAQAPVSGRGTPTTPRPAAAPITTPVASAAAALSIGPPPPGVYSYRTEGYEEAGVRRTLPAESQRIIQLKDARTYSNHHIFSEEHQEWFTLRGTDRGGVMLERRVRIVIGPITQDDTITFDPPLLGVPLPYRQGEHWQGSFSGKNAGTYTGETIDHKTIRIGNEDVEVWVERVHIHIAGSFTGDVNVDLWFSPKYQLFPREEAVYDLKSGPATYHSEYTITLQSLEPKA